MDKQTFFAALRKRGSGVFGTALTQAQVTGIEGILAAFDEVGDGWRDTLAYGLATAYWETGRAMIPNRENLVYTSAARIRQVFARHVRTDADARALVRKPVELARAVYNGRLGNRIGTDDGWIYRGGGHMHLTGRDNYARSSADAGVDLVANPEGILDPRISGRILFKGLQDGRWNGQGKGIRAYAEADGNMDMDRDDLVAARRTVNIQDRAAEIASIAEAFERALIEAGMPARVQRKADAPAATAGAAPWWVGLLGLVATFFKGKRA